MSYLEDIEPHIERIKLQQEGRGSIRNRELLLEIANTFILKTLIN